MASTPKTIEAAKKAAATNKARALEFIRANPGTIAGCLPMSRRRWLRTLENEGLIEYRSEGWYTK